MESINKLPTYGLALTKSQLHSLATKLGVQSFTSEGELHAIGKVLASVNEILSKTSDTNVIIIGE